MSAPPLPSSLFQYKRVAGTNPAANAEVSDTVPAGKVWWLLAVNIACVQGATQTPQPAITIDDGTTVYFTSVGSTTAQSVSTTVTYTWAPSLSLTGLIGATPNIISTGGLGEFLFLAAGHRIKTVTAGIGANTDYGAPSYFVCEFTT
jgi:hypothetical protein